MRKHIAIAMLFSLIFLAGGFPVHAVADQTGGNNQIVVNESDLPPDLLAKIKAQKEAEATSAKIKAVGEYAGLGAEIGEAVNGALAAVTRNSEKFANTKVGRFTMWIVAWKIVLVELLSSLMALLLWIMGSWVLIWSYRRTCIPQPILVEESEGGKKTFEAPDPGKDEDLDARRLIHAIIWVCLTLIAVFKV